MVLVGDSVLRYIDPKKIQPEGERLQKLFVPGLCIEDLQHWLSTTNPCPDVKQATIHVGINNCPAGAVTTEEWLDLVAGCRKTFPRASLRLSSIIPARGRHNLNNAITPSNNNLHTACRRVGVMVIDNKSSFTAKTGAPRLAMYSETDPRHPSRQGAIKLALNFKYAGSDRANNDNNNNENRPVNDRQHRRQQSSQSSPNLANSGSANGPSNDGSQQSSQPPFSSHLHYPPLFVPSHAVPPLGSAPPPPPPLQHSTAQQGTPFSLPHHPGQLATQYHPSSMTRQDTSTLPASGPGQLHYAQPSPSGWGTLHPYALPFLNMLAAQQLHNGGFQTHPCV